MLKAVRTGGPHHVATYIIEACFWALSLESRAFLERLPRLGSMRRNKTIKPQRLGLWFEAAEALQDGYDHGIPLPFRLKAVSRVLDERAEERGTSGADDEPQEELQPLVGARPGLGGGASLGSPLVLEGITQHCPAAGAHAPSAPV